MAIGSKTTPFLEQVFHASRSGQKPENAMRQSLAVLLRHDGFSVLIAGRDSGNIQALAEYRCPGLGSQFYSGQSPHPAIDAYFKALASQEWISLPFGSVAVAVASPRFTVLPEAFVGDGRQILPFTQPFHENDTLVGNSIYEKGPVVQMAVPGQILQRIRNLLPSAAIHPASGALLNGILRNHSQIIARQIFLNLYDDFLEIAVIQGMRLLYLNAFKYSVPQDVVYYLIFVLEQIGFEPATEEITLIGAVDRNDETCRLLSMYCGKIRFSNTCETLDAYGLIPQEMHHRFFTLINLTSCG